MPTGYCNVPGSRVRRPVIVPIGPSIAYVPLTKGLFALIDREDAERVTLHSWVAMKPRYNWYAAARINYKYVPLHRFLLDPPEGMVVDHRDTQRTLDNRRNCGQIRLATPSQNNFNRTLRRVTKSGLRAVPRRCITVNSLKPTRRYPKQRCQPKPRDTIFLPPRKGAL